MIDRGKLFFDQLMGMGPVIRGRSSNNGEGTIELPNHGQGFTNDQLMKFLKGEIEVKDILERKKSE